MTEVTTTCSHCKDHSGVESTLFHIRELLDEREKQANIQAQANQEAVRVAKQAVDAHLLVINEFQHRMERLENTFATKTELQSLFKFVYIGIGIIIAFQVLIKFVKF